MIVGVPKEIKTREQRVGLTPVGVRMLKANNHRVWVEKGAGLGSGISDEAYSKAGAEILPSASDIWAAELIVKVKEPLPQEFEYLRSGQAIFTFFHLAAERTLTLELLKKNVTSIAYETIQESDGSLPLLRPMSEVAGRMSVQVGAYYLQSSWDSSFAGKGLLLGGVPGVSPGRVTIIGGGVAGSNAASVALGMGAAVTILDLDVRRLEYFEHIFKGRLVTLMSNVDNIDESVSHADLVIGSVLVPGARAPKLVSQKMISQMAPGSVVVDIAVDQGGCTETCKPTSHEKPTFIVNGVIHYCVTNMPGAVAHTSTVALTNATLKYLLEITQKGLDKCAESPAIRKGFNTFQGQVVHNEVAKAHGLKFKPLD